MQFSIITMLGLSAFAIAAPAPIADPAAIEAELVARNGGQKVCCQWGSYSQCSPCSQYESCPDEKPQEYNSCSQNQQTSLVGNLFVCDVLSGNTLNFPVTLSVL